MNASATLLNIKRAIWENGWLAFHAGYPAEGCPWGTASNGRRYWLSGWQCGKSGCQKPPPAATAKKAGTNLATTQPRCIGCE